MEEKQPSSETAQAAVEKIRKKSYREIEDSAELIKISLDLLPAGRQVSFFWIKPNEAAANSRIP